MIHFKFWYFWVNKPEAIQHFNKLISMTFPVVPKINLLFRLAIVKNTFQNCFDSMEGQKKELRLG